MSDLKTELESKVLPALQDWEREAREQPSEAPIAPVSKTQMIYAAVRSNPGQLGADYVKLLEGSVLASSVYSLIAQLCDKGYLRKTDDHPQRYWPTDKIHVEKPIEAWRQEALKKAHDKRRENAEASRAKKAAAEAKAARKAARQAKADAKAVDRMTQSPLPPKEATTQTQPTWIGLAGRSPTEIVGAMDVRTARAVMDELKSLFGV